MRYAIVTLLQILSFLLQILSYAIIADALLSWFMPPNNRIRMVLSRICGPFVYPFRMLMRRFATTGMPIDISPLLAYLAISLLQGIIRQLMFMV